MMHNLNNVLLCMCFVSRVSQRLAKVAGNDKCADCGDISKYAHCHHSNTDM